MAENELGQWNALGMFPDPVEPATLKYNTEWVWAMDDSTDEYVFVPFVMPVFTGTLKLKLYYYMDSATSGTVELNCRLEAITPGDAANVETNSYDTAEGVSETVPGTAGYMSAPEITISNDDSVAAGDKVRLRILRQATDATNDTATGDLYLLHAYFFEEV